VARVTKYLSWTDCIDALIGGSSSMVDQKSGLHATLLPAWALKFGNSVMSVPFGLSCE
jgi:hypothetical protein